MNATGTEHRNDWAAAWRSYDSPRLEMFLLLHAPEYTHTLSSSDDSLSTVLLLTCPAKRWGLLFLK